MCNCSEEKTTFMGSRNLDLTVDLFRAASSAILPSNQRKDADYMRVRTFHEEMGPGDPLEAMLYSQLFSLHSHAMALMADAQKSLVIDMREKHLSMANRLLKTFNATLETLGKHLRKGQQVIKVNHVHVNDGGQAVLGNFKTQDKGVG